MNDTTSFEVENQLLLTSRRRWFTVATELYRALDYRLPNYEQVLHHTNAKTLYLQLLKDEESTFPSPIQDRKV